MTRTGANIDVTFQVAEVNTQLGSVRRLCQAGNRAAFEGENEGSYIEHIESGQRIPIYLKYGQYRMHLWIRKEGSKPSDEMTVGGTFAALMERIEEEDPEEVMKAIEREEDEESKEDNAPAAPPKPVVKRERDEWQTHTLHRGELPKNHV